MSLSLREFRPRCDKLSLCEFRPRCDKLSLREFRPRCDEESVRRTVLNHRAQCDTIILNSPLSILN